MPSSEPQYDIAFSLTSTDRGFVKRLVASLPDFRCFFYLERDRELTGASALGPMREAFRYGSKLQVIVHRPPWGKTGYTKLEHEAICDRYFGTENAPPPFLIRMDLSYPKPDWIPDTVTWCDRSKFSIKKIADQIREKFETRVVPRTGSSTKTEFLTHLVTTDQVRQVRLDVANAIAKRVAMRSQQARREHLLKTSDGFDLALSYMAEVQEHFAKYAKEFEITDPEFHVEYARMTPAPYWFVISSKTRSVRIKWDRDGGPSIRDDKLIIEYCKDPATVPGKTKHIGYWHGEGNDPRLIEREYYVAEINNAEVFVWTMQREEIDYELHLGEYPHDPEELAYHVIDRLHELHQANPPKMYKSRGR